VGVILFEVVECIFDLEEGWKEPKSVLRTLVDLAAQAGLEIGSA
jgi:hypothetical protein